MGKVQDIGDMARIVEDARNEGKTIVATNGCFDILHIGHVRNLKMAKELGDILIVGVNSDASVRTNKGDTRPIVPEDERVEVIAAIDAVDYAFLFSERTPFSWIQELRPNIHVKGGADDVRNHPDFAEQQRIVEESGGTIVLLPHQEGRSTSNIIRKIKESE